MLLHFPPIYHGGGTNRITLPHLHLLHTIFLSQQLTLVVEVLGELGVHGLRDKTLRRHGEFRLHRPAPTIPQILELGHA